MTSAAFADQIARPGGAIAVWRPWLVGRPGAMLLGVGNGIARGALYEGSVGPRRAEHIRLPYADEEVSR
jgi:hypothetical protein